MQKIIMKKNKLHNALDLLSTMMQVVIVKCAAFCLQLSSLLGEAKPESCHVAYLNAFFSNFPRNRGGAHCIFAHFQFHFTSSAMLTKHCQLPTPAQCPHLIV